MQPMWLWISWSCDLKTRLKTHSGEKPTKYNQRDYAFNQAGNLETHLNMHNGKKSDKCILCDYASSRAGNLRRHLKTNVMSDLESCQANNLTRHLKTHTGKQLIYFLLLSVIFWFPHFISITFTFHFLSFCVFYYFGERAKWSFYRGQSWQS